MFKSIATLLATSMASQPSRIFGAENIQRYLQRQKRDHARHAHTSIAKLNRHTDAPHEHRREIARHLRQAR